MEVGGQALLGASNCSPRASRVQRLHLSCRGCPGLHPWLTLTTSGNYARRESCCYDVSCDLMCYWIRVDCMFYAFKVNILRCLSASLGCCGGPWHPDEGPWADAVELGGGAGLYEAPLCAQQACGEEPMWALGANLGSPLSSVAQGRSVNSAEPQSPHL